MTYRCEYCGQLFEGLSCPHCLAPRGDIFDLPIIDVSDMVRDTGYQFPSDYVKMPENMLFADNVPYWTDGLHTYWTDEIHAVNTEITDIDMKPDPEPREYVFVDIDPYKDEQVFKVGASKPDVTGCLVAMFAVMVPALLVGVPVCAILCAIFEALGWL